MSPQITITELETMIRGGAVSEQGWTEDQLAEMERRWTVEPRVVYELHPRDDDMPPLTLLATLDRRAPQDVLNLIAEVRRLTARLAAAERCVEILRWYADGRHWDQDGRCGQYEPVYSGSVPEPYADFEPDHGGRAQRSLSLYEKWLARATTGGQP